MSPGNTTIVVDEKLNSVHRRNIYEGLGIESCTELIGVLGDES